MANRLFDKTIVVTRKTELQELLARFTTVAQTRFYLEHAGQPFAAVKRAHDIHQTALDRVCGTLSARHKWQLIDRAMLPQFSFGEDDLVITVGQDGLVSNTAKYLDGQPILGINPDPERFDGVLLPFTAETVGEGLARLESGDAALTSVSLAQVTLDDGQTLLAFNDFFIGAQSHVSARYRVQLRDLAENQSSSGILVSTGAGSTGWLQSVYTGAAAIIKHLGGTVVPPADFPTMSWDTDQLVFSVREPFPSLITGTSLVHGRIGVDETLIVESQMGLNGVIFSDGIEADYLTFNTGARAEISLAPRKATLVAH